MEGTQLAAGANEPRFVERYIRETINEVLPLFLCPLRRIFIGRVRSPLRETQMAQLPNQLIVAAHDRQPRPGFRLISLGKVSISSEMCPLEAKPSFCAISYAYPQSLPSQRERLKRFSEEELIRFGKASCYMCSTEAQLFGGKRPRTRFLSVGTLIALTYVLTLDDPHRFRRSRDAGCFNANRAPGRQSSELPP